MKLIVLQLVVELLVFAAAVVVASFNVEVHLVAALIIGGLFALLIRLALILGTLGGLRVRAWLRPPSGQFWKSGGGWGEWR